MDGQKPQVLYLDDEEHNLTAFVAAFRRYYTIFTTTSAAEAIEILKKNNIELIITDQRMPEMTGVEFLEKIIPQYPSPVRMILTGFSDIEAITKSINNGAVLRYITKPWDPNELKQIIDMGVKIHTLEESERQLINYMEVELEQQNRAIELFKKYVPENVFLQVVGPQHESSPTTGENRVISILFVDIYEFAKFSKTLEPKNLVRYLNSYFATIINCISKNHGFIYKLVGDGLIAIFGAPISSSSHAQNAVTCALDMTEVLKEFNESTATEYKHETQISIGISTGNAIVGHIVSEHFMSYAAIGEAVDMAAKIKNSRQDIANTILISEATYNALKNDFQTEAIQAVTIEGRNENLYKVLGVAQLET